MRKLMLAVALSLLVPSGRVWSKDKKPAPETAAAPAAKTAASAPAIQAPIFVKVGNQKVQIPVGTQIRLEVQEKIVGHKNSIGQQVNYLVVEDVAVADGKVVIKKGAAAVGHVLARGGIGGNFSLVRKAGKVTFNAESVTAIDGTQVPLNFIQTFKGQGGLGMTLMFGGGKGKNAKIKQGAIIEAVIGQAPFVEDNEASEEKNTAKKKTKKKVKAEK